MNKKTILAAFFTLASLVAITPVVFTNSSGAPGGVSGGTGEGTCAAAGCHQGNSLNAAGGALTIEVKDGSTSVTTYEPGKTYDVTITAHKDGVSRYGFQSSVRSTGTTTHAGTLAAGAGTRLISAGTRRWITHTAPVDNTTARWDFTWTAPSSTTLNVTVYSAANAANADDDKTGDFIYTSRYALTPASGVSVSEQQLLKENMRVSPSPARHYVAVSFANPNNYLSHLQVLTLDGRQVDVQPALRSDGVNRRYVFGAAPLRPGLYLVRLQVGASVATQKFMKE